jgi:hypothetical protein
MTQVFGRQVVHGVTLRHVPADHQGSKCVYECVCVCVCVCVTMSSAPPLLLKAVMANLKG